MAWIKADDETPEKAQVLELVQILGKPLPHVLGALWLVWRWFSNQTVAGQSATCPGTLDQVSGTPGLGEALIRVRWLVWDSEAGTITMPNFDRHTGSSHETRVKRAWRQKNLSGDSPGTVRRPSGRCPKPDADAESDAEQEPLATLGGANVPSAQPPIPESIPKPLRARKKATGTHAEAIQAWEGLWFDSRGVKWVWDEKSAVNVAACLRKSLGSLEAFRDRARRLLFDPPDEWTAANASPSLLCSRWNELGVRVSVKKNGSEAVRARIEAGQREMDKLRGYFDGRS